MNDEACEVCRRDWHGAAKCGRKVTVEVSQRMYFSESGAGPLYAKDVNTSAPGKIETATAACACRG